MKPQTTNGNFGERTSRHGAGQPLTFYIKRNSLDDGPGIRTTVFFKGCPLSCVWCHNPESRKKHAELSHDKEKCIGCGACASACARGAISPGGATFIDRSVCSLCFNCSDVCPSRALEKLGGLMDVPQIVSIIKKDIPFFKTSGGGVTLSGGEPTLFTDFCAELLDECKKLSVNTLIETSGMFDPAAFTDLLLPLLDTVFFDLKIYDSKTHKEKCGVGNEVILNNFKRLNETCRDAAGPRLLGRIPLIPGITDTDENLEALAAFLRECGAGEVSLLPYNPTWLNKSAMVDAELRYDNSKWMSEDDLKRCRSHFKGFAII